MPEISDDNRSKNPYCCLGNRKSAKQTIEKLLLSSWAYSIIYRQLLFKDNKKRAV
jgi:hypothetical protein